MYFMLQEHEVGKQAAVGEGVAGRWWGHAAEEAK